MTTKVILDCDTGHGRRRRDHARGAPPRPRAPGGHHGQRERRGRVLHRQHAARAGPHRPFRHRRSRGLRRPIVRTDFPVPRGSTLNPTSSIHGRELPLPPPTTRKQDTGAVEYLVETFRRTTTRSPWCRSGPLSNIAAAIAIEPAHRRRGPRGRDHGRRQRQGQRHAVGRVQHLGRPGGRGRGVRGGLPKHHPGPARRDAPGARLAGRSATSSVRWAPRPARRRRR